MHDRGENASVRLVSFAEPAVREADIPGWD